MIIMPLMKIMVLQLMPVFISFTAAWPVYQNVVVAMLPKLRASSTAAQECISPKKTTIRVRAPAQSVTI